MEKLLIAATILVGLWIFNILLSIPLRRVVDKEDEFFKKVVENGNSMFYCLIGIILIGISDNWIPFLKWPLLIITALYLIYNIGMFLFSLIASIGLLLASNKSVKGIDFWVISSNFLLLIAISIIAYLIANVLFGWI